MGASEIEDMLEVWFLFEEEPNRTSITESINKCLEIGCSTKKDGQTDLCKYHPPNFKEPSKTISTSTAINKISSSGEGGIEFWYKNIRVDFELNLAPHIFTSTPHLALKIWSAQFRSYKDGDGSDVTERVLQFLELVRPIAELLDPKYAFGSIDTRENDRGIFPEQTLEHNRVRYIFWVNIFSDSIIDQIGEKQLLSAPAWKVERLSNGSILLVVNENPRDYVDKAKEIEQFLGI